MATGVSFAVRAGSSSHGVNRPWTDTGWRVGMPVGSNYPKTTPIQFNRLTARGAIREDGTQFVTFATVRGYGILGA